MANYTEFNLFIKLNEEEVQILNHIKERQKNFLSKYGAIESAKDLTLENVMCGKILEAIEEEKKLINIIERQMI